MGLTRTSAAAGILIRGRVNPIISMALIPVVGAFIWGFGLGEISDFFSEGLNSIINVLMMTVVGQGSF